MSLELVQTTTSDGVRLDGAYQKPDYSLRSELGVDVMILHHGVGGNFYGSGPFEDFGPWLVEKGCAAIRVNNRGHDAVSQANVGGTRKRLGAAYEIIDDCRQDWSAWIDFAQEAGYKRIGVWGHSLGAVKSIYHMALDGDTRVQCVVASSPPRFSYSTFVNVDEWEGAKNVGERDAKDCARAQQCLNEGHPDELIEVEWPRPMMVSAKTYIDKYGPEEKYDVVKHIPAVPVPLFTVIGTKEPHDQFPFFGLPEEMQKLAGELDHFTFEYIDGADHPYTHHRKEVWDVTSKWLAGL